MEEGEAVEELQPPPLTCVGPADRSVPDVRDKCGIIECLLAAKCPNVHQDDPTMRDSHGESVPASSHPSECTLNAHFVCSNVFVYFKSSLNLKVPKQVSVPSPPRYVKKCNTVTETREQCRTVYVDKHEQVPKKTCNNVLVEKCEPYRVPNTNVVTDETSGTKFFTGIKTCEIATEPAQHCARLPTKEICKPRKVRLI